MCVEERKRRIINLRRSFRWDLEVVADVDNLDHGGVLELERGRGRVVGRFPVS